MIPITAFDIIQLIVIYGPDLTAEIVGLFRKPDPTLDDWRALYAKIMPYEEKRRAAFARAGVPETPLPPA